MTKEIALRPLLDDATGIHDGDGIRDLQQQRQIMGNEQQGELQLIAQLQDLVEDFSLHHNVERGRGFIHDDDLGQQSERDGDGGSLAHTSA